MTIRFQNLRGYIALLASPLRYKKGVIPSLLSFLILSIGTAWSYEGYRPPVNYDVSLETSTNKSIPSSAVMDVCKSLLKSNQHIPSNSVTARNQRTAGKVAALGIILGARFALSPKDNATTSRKLHKNIVARHNKKTMGNDRSALAIAAFRQCQKEQVLAKVASVK